MEMVTAMASAIVWNNAGMVETVARRHVWMDIIFLVR
jgi:hypothetical protein